MLFVDGVINIANQLGDDFVDLEIFVSGFFGWAGDDEWGARFVDQDGIDFIDDGEVMAALHAVSEIVLHVVAKVVEAEFVVGAVSDVGPVGGATLLVIEVVHDYADGEAEGAIERAHPFGVAAGEVIVYGDDVHAAASQSVQSRWQSGY